MKTTLGLRLKFSPTILALLTGAGAIFAVSQASALTVVFDDGNNGTNELVITDGDSADGFPGEDGNVSFSGPLDTANGATADTNWNINFTLGANDDGSFQLDLGSINESATGGTLRVSVYDSFDPASPLTAPTFLGAYGGTLDSGATVASVTFSQFDYESTPTSLTPGAVGTLLSGATATIGPFSTSTSVGDAGGMATFANGATGSPKSFDLGIDVVVTHTGAQSTQFTAKLNPVPIPGAAILFGSALFGTVFVGRRKKVTGKGLKPSRDRGESGGFSPPFYPALSS